MLSFETPWALALLPLAILVVIVANRFGKSAQRSSAQLDTSAIGSLSTRLRLVSACLLALAIANPRLDLRTDRRSTVVAIDVSRSIAPAFLDRKFQEVEQWQSSQRGEVTLVAFADRAASADDIDDLGALPMGAAGGDGAIRRHASNLEAAIDRSLASFDPDAAKHLILISDGVFNQGSDSSALARIVATDVRVDALPAEVRVVDAPRIEAVDSAARVQAGTPKLLGLHLFAQQDTPVIVSAETEGGELLSAAEYRLESGSNRVDFPVVLEEPGATTFELALQLANITQDGTLAPSGNETDRIPVVIDVDERQRLLYVEGADAASARGYFESAMRIQGFEVRSSDQASLPTDPSAYLAYDAVVLSDLPADGFSEQQMLALEGWVRDLGGGLLFVAGESTFGEDGYAGSALERILPIEFKVKEEKSDVAMMIVLDKSYSMRGQKIELARTAAKAALDVLEDDHKFGLIAFDWNPTLVVPLQEASGREAIKELIQRVEATAQTNFFPALEMAHARLLEVDAKTRHVVLLSDGKTYPDAYERLLTKMAADGLTVSTVAVGEEADRDLLAEIAEWGSGRSYFIADARRVISVLVDEAEKTLQDTVVEESTRALIRERTPVLRGIDLARMPAVRGHINTTERDRAQVWLETPDEQPLLASWEYGAGLTTIYTSDIKNRWGADIVQWSGYGPLFAQLVRHLAIDRSQNQPLFSLEKIRDGVRVTVDVVRPDGSFWNGLQPVLQIGGDRREIPQVEPGRYQVEHRLEPSPNPTPFRVQIPDNGFDQTRFWIEPDWPEASVHGPDIEKLEQVASAGGGLVVQSFDELTDIEARKTERRLELWPWLAALGLLTFLGELLRRRFPVGNWGKVESTA